MESRRQASNRAWLALPRAWLVWLVWLVWPAGEFLFVFPSDPIHQLLLSLHCHCRTVMRPTCASRRPRWRQWRQSDHRPPGVIAPGLHPSDHLFEPTQNDGGCQTVVVAGFHCLAAIIRNSTRGGLISPSRQGPCMSLLWNRLANRALLDHPMPLLGRKLPCIHGWTNGARHGFNRAWTPACDADLLGRRARRHPRSSARRAAGQPLEQPLVPS